MHAIIRVARVSRKKIRIQVAAKTLQVSTWGFGLFPRELWLQLFNLPKISVIINVIIDLEYFVIQNKYP